VGYRVQGNPRKARQQNSLQSDAKRWYLVGTSAKIPVSRRAHCAGKQPPGPMFADQARARLPDLSHNARNS
ncbi:uncharacterized protein METZ01_LOCUS343084, partial [marine metagenome]